VLLIVEVAHSSLSYDRGEKAALYAAAGISDYWVVNLRDGRVEVHRDPAEGKYRGVQLLTGDEKVRPLAMPEMVLRPGSLLQE
jgi:Uma2 family endonuclease